MKACADAIQFPLCPYDISGRATSFSATVTMIGKAKERWMELCEQAANEQDPHKLMELVTEINRLLVEKEKRLAIRSFEPPQE
jgi:hypothetical protein